MENRVTELEIRMTHLEHTIEVLNSTIIKQHDEIDHLKLQVSVLEKKLKATQATIIAPESEETPPPHY
jgi:SlyX protein